MLWLNDFLLVGSHPKNDDAGGQKRSSNGEAKCLSNDVEEAFSRINDGVREEQTAQYKENRSTRGQERLPRCVS